MMHLDSSLVYFGFVILRGKLGLVCLIFVLSNEIDCMDYISFVLVEL